MSAEQILHVVLRGHEQDVDASFVHQAIEPIRVEGDGGCNLLDYVESMIEASFVERTAHCAC